MRTIFDIGSTSKQFTAAAIQLLALDGKLSLDDDLRKFIPELPDYNHKITIRHLLHHTSGLRDYLTLWGVAGQSFDDTTTSEDALRLILRQRLLNFAPGTEHLYSNSGYFLLSEIVKRVTGKTLRAYAGEKIFAPLGMKNTHFHDDHRMIVPLRSTGYAPAPGGFRIEMSNFEQTGDGAVYTSIEDLLLWDRNFYDPKVGGRALLDRMQQTGVLNDGEKLTYASGLIVERYRGLETVSHGGSWAGYRAELLRFPTEKTSIICLCNLATTNPSRLARQVADVLLADKLQPIVELAPKTPVAPAPLSEAEKKSVVGLYRHPSNGELRRVTLSDGKLRLDAFGPGSGELESLGGITFRVASGDRLTEVSFTRADNDRANSLQLTRPNLQPRVYTVVAEFMPSAAQLEEYAGEYYSSELDASQTVRVIGNELKVTTRNRIYTLAPTFRDGFVVAFGGVQFEFSRNAEGRTTAYTMNAGRIRGLLFVKRS